MKLSFCGLIVSTICWTSTLRQRKGRALPSIDHVIPSRDNAGSGGSACGGVGGVHKDDTYMTPLGHPGLLPRSAKKCVINAEMSMDLSFSRDVPRYLSRTPLVSAEESRMEEASASSEHHLPPSRSRLHHLEIRALISVEAANPSVLKLGHHVNNA